MTISTDIPLVFRALFSKNNAELGEKDILGQPPRKLIEVSVDDSVKILRELQGLSQNRLAELTGIAQPTISAIEHGRTKLGVERAKIFARALKCHPAVLLFHGWNVGEESAA